MGRHRTMGGISPAQVEKLKATDQSKRRARMRLQEISESTSEVNDALENLARVPASIMRRILRAEAELEEAARQLGRLSS